MKPTPRRPGHPPRRLAPARRAAVGALCLWLLACRRDAETRDVYVYRTVDAQDLSVYVTRPADDSTRDGGPRPAIVFFHGGGWVGGSADQFTAHARHFAARGLVSFQVEYRLLSPGSTDPPEVCVQDAVAAMRWVRSHHAQFGIDPERIASAGGSAGGHLAAYVGCVDVDGDPSRAARSNAMILYNPVVDTGPGGFGHERMGERYPRWSPLHHLSPDDPPSIVLMGSRDELVPLASARRFTDTSRALGVPSELVVYEGRGHGFHNDVRESGRYYALTLAEVERFLVERGWIAGPPPRRSASSP